jgi:putative endonuclease
MYSKQEVGMIGEKIAYKYMESKGAKILTKNWRPKVKTAGSRGEIDLICIDNKNTLIIVEVKARMQSNFGPLALEQVTKKKYTQLKHLSSCYIYENELDNYKNIRIDVIGIEIQNDICKVAHIKDVYFE